jgi:uncharacterized phage protein gp47/JayE
MTYGLTTDGLTIKTLNVIRAELIQRIWDTFGISVKADSDRAIVGQVVGIVSELASIIWELLEAVNSSQDPEKATGAALDALCTLTGTFRPPASYSAVTLTLTGTPTTVVPDGSTVDTESTAVEFETVGDATIDTADAWGATTAYALEDRVTNSGNVYECTLAGTSAGSGGPTTEEETITDGSVEWTFLGAGTGAVDVLAKASETGPVVAAARDLTVITSEVSGWDGVINLLDATPGRNVASDEELRLLREAQLAGSGNTPIDSLRADLLDLDDVVAVTIFVNNTDTTDGDGMPPGTCWFRPDRVRQTPRKCGCGYQDPWYDDRYGN